MSFKDKVVFITGSSRGIGKAIAKRLAREDAHIVVAAKTVEPHPKLEGTIFTAAEEISSIGNGRAFPVQLDIRSEESIENAVDKVMSEFGRIDILINNASAINLSQVEKTEPKRYDLMFDINVRGTFFMSRACIPHLKKSDNPHILNLSPPLNMDGGWFGRHLAYTMSKYGMSMVIKGLSEEFKDDRIAANALWPRTTIATAAVQNLLGGDYLVQKSRTPEIVADAAYFILKRNSEECTGNFFIDEEILQEEGIEDFLPYAVNATQELMPDIFL